ncbi:hypothetical protein BGZ98_010341 [Dissophora globulifera]|nr:hypothetical protein BGZ98_010341 [Dissophora globulifera]
MHITENDIPPSRVKLEGLIPHISSYLSKAQNELDIQLQELEGIVTEKNHIIFQQAAREKPQLIIEFLCILEEYLDSTLNDFFHLIDQISVLIEDYDQTLEMFLEGSDLTLKNVQRCIHVVGSLVERHGKTIHDLSVTSSMTNYLMRHYHSKVDCTPKSMARGASSKAQNWGGSKNNTEIQCQAWTEDVTKNQTETGWQTTSVSKDVTVTRIVKEDQIDDQSQILTEIVTKTEAETVTQIASPKINKDKIEYTDGQLKNIQVANNEFPMLIHLICDKLEVCNKFLEDTKEPLHEQGISTTISLDVYADAQEEAKRIFKCCKEIRGYALRVVVLKRKFLHRTEQIEEQLKSSQQYSL